MLSRRNILALVSSFSCFRAVFLSSPVASCTRQSCFTSIKNNFSFNNKYCTSTLLQSRDMHEKARCAIYPLKGQSDPVKRFAVPDDKVEWNKEWTDYAPLEFTAPFVLTAVWADPPLDKKDFSPSWNSLDEKVNRKSHEGEYKIQDGRPLNPHGRTGLSGRGILGRWGPNHAADPVVTRWQRDAAGSQILNTDSGLPVLEFVCIERGDGGGWAIPGGMVDPGEKVSTALKREFMEEAMDSTQASSEENAENSALVDKFFSEGTEVYKGYVDDPRNTDNAWMETVVMSFHDSTGDSVGKLKLKAGDDAKNLKWMAIDDTLTLYASHKAFVKKVAELLKAHW